MKYPRLLALLALPLTGLGFVAPAFAADSATATVNTSTTVSTRAIVRQGKITAITGSSITIEGQTFSIDASSAVIVRRFGGKSSLAELSVGDSIRVVGVLNGTVLTAKHIRDNSTEERN